MERPEEVIDEVRRGSLSDRSGDSYDERTVFSDDLFRKFSKQDKDDLFHADV